MLVFAPDEFDVVVAVIGVAVATPLGLLVTWWAVRTFVSTYNKKVKGLQSAMKQSKTPSPVKYVDATRLIGSPVDVE
jgi:hypothetical protein